MNLVLKSCLGASITIAAAAPMALQPITAQADSDTKYVVNSKYSVLLISSNTSGSERTTSTAGPPKFIPRTKLGKTLWDARKKIVASGEPLTPSADLMRDLRISRG